MVLGLVCWLCAGLVGSTAVLADEDLEGALDVVFPFQWLTDIDQDRLT